MKANEFDFPFYKSATTAARGNKGYPAPSTSFRAFRKFGQSVNYGLCKDRKEMEQDFEEMAKTLNEKTLRERRADREKVFNDFTATRQESMTRTLERVIKGKREAIKQYTMIPPKQEHIAMIDLADKRFDSISETEWLMLTESVANNYQESAYLQSIAKKHGKDYDIPYEPEQAYRDLDELEKRIKEDVISHIAEDPHNTIEMAQFFRHEDGTVIYGRINQLAEYFDDLPIGLVEEPILELTEEQDFTTRLLNARQVCWNNNAKSLWKENIHLELEIQKDGLNEDNLARGEKLIKIVNELFPDGVDTE